MPLETAIGKTSYSRRMLGKTIQCVFYWVSWKGNAVVVGIFIEAEHEGKKKMRFLDEYFRGLN